MVHTHAYNIKSIIAFTLAGILVLSGYFLSKAVARAHVAVAPICSIEGTQESAEPELHVVGCSGIL